MISHISTTKNLSPVIKKIIKKAVSGAEKAKIHFMCIAASVMLITNVIILGKQNYYNMLRIRKSTSKQLLALLQ